MAEMYCDFCRDTEPGWILPCTDFEIVVGGLIPTGSGGPWMACDWCMARIRTGDWATLNQRSTDKYRQRFPTGHTQGSSLRFITMIHGKFATNWDGRIFTVLEEKST